MSNPYDSYVNSSTTADEEKRRIALMSGHTGISDQASYARGEDLSDIHQAPAPPKTQENARTGN
jgi:hypothetical protein